MNSELFHRNAPTDSIEKVEDYMAEPLRRQFEERADKPRWWWHSVEHSRTGSTGPFGPIEAHTFDEARGIAAVRAKASGLSVRYVERADDKEWRA